MSPAASTTVRPTVGLCGVGAMGSAFGRRLGEGGLRVVTDGSRRSPATRSRLAAAGIEDLGDLGEVVAQADLVFSIMGSATAGAAAEDVLAALERSTARRPVFIECNLADPQQVVELGERFGALGVAVLDVGIVGPPPQPGGAAPTFYVAGPDPGRLFFLREHGFDVQVAGAALGAASALKVCSAAVWQGCLALIAEVAVTAARYGCADAFLTDLREHQTQLHDWFVPALAEAPERARRWSGDMLTVGTTMAHVGTSSGYHFAAARLYDAMAGLSSPPPSTPDLVAALGRLLPPAAGASPDLAGRPAPEPPSPGDLR